MTQRKRILLGLALIALLAAVPSAHAALGDATADGVLGQTSFTSTGAAGGAGLNGPGGVAIDRSVTPNRVYVADTSNHRVLGWADASGFANGAAADRVIGQPDFTATACNLGAAFPSNSSLCFPNFLAVDAAGNLYVDDYANHRVLEYDRPFATDAVADRVFGQAGSFTSGDCNHGGVSASSLCFPLGVAVDAAGNLYVAEFGNSRVLEYDTPLTTNTIADQVFGQGGSFTSSACNTGGLSASSLCNPRGVAVDASGNLYVADYNNFRILEYNTPLITDTTADRVFGQAGSFTTSACSGISAASVCDAAGVAVDSSGNLYVADQGRSRVLEYDTPLTTDTTADRVFGQGGSFTTNICNGGGVSGSTLCSPFALSVDAPGSLFVADQGNNRMLRYDVPLPPSRLIFQSADFDGDGLSDKVIFTPQGQWSVLRSSNGTTLTAQWGTAGDIPVAGDYTGDGKADFAVFRPSNGTWYVLPTDGSPFFSVIWGSLQDIPVPGNYTGHGKSDFVVYRPSVGTWFVKPSDGSAFFTVQWGAVGDVPVPGDFDGDGKRDYTVFRPSTGTWYVKPASGSAFFSTQFGIAGDVPLAADFAGSAADDYAIFRPTTGQWYVQRSDTLAVLPVVQWGAVGDVALPANMGGDGKADYVVYRPSTKTWFTQRSDTLAALPSVAPGFAAGTPIAR